MKKKVFNKSYEKPESWKANWIWIGKPGNSAAVCLRKEVFIEKNPSSVKAWISGDIKYRLYVNGCLAVRGPVDIGCDWGEEKHRKNILSRGKVNKNGEYQGGTTGRWFYDTRDLTAFFKKGLNVISVEVFQEWPIIFTVSTGVHAFIFESEIKIPGKKKIILKTGPVWRGIPAA